MTGLVLIDGTWAIGVSCPAEWEQDVYKGGNTPIGSYPDDTCVEMRVPGRYVMVTDVVVS